MEHCAKRRRRRIGAGMKKRSEEREVHVGRVVGSGSLLSPPSAQDRGVSLQTFLLRKSETWAPKKN